MVKGALVELVSGIGGSIPNVVLFQFNPETMRHSLTQASAPATGATAQTMSNALAVSGVPSESFSFSLSMDVTDQLADPDPIVARDAGQNGIYARLAALEMLLYPIEGKGSSNSGTTKGTSGSGSGSSGSSSGGTSRPTPAAQLPTVLFVWGAARILPVRVTSLTITEKLYDTNLNPTHADAQLELRVLTPDELRSVPGELGKFATAAYQYTQSQRAARAAANLGDAGRAVIGMLGDKHVLP